MVDFAVHGFPRLQLAGEDDEVVCCGGYYLGGTFEGVGVGYAAPCSFERRHLQTCSPVRRDLKD